MLFTQEVMLVLTTRILFEHPPDEADTAIFDNGYHPRVLGIGQPSRCFGNTTFKLPEGESQR